jgi:hypothetical protein
VSAGSFLVVADDGTGDYTCDGIDDDVEINQAITDMSTIGGGTIYIKAGTYLLSNVLKIRSNVTLIGDGMGQTVIKAKNSYSPTLNAFGGKSLIQPVDSSALNHVRLLNITWDGNGQNVTGAGNVFDTPIFLQTSTNTSSYITIEGCEIKNAIRYSNWIGRCHYLWLRKNVITSGWSNSLANQDGFHLNGCEKFWIEDNYIDTYGSGTSGDDAIAIQQHPTTSGPKCRYGVISRNVIKSYARGILLTLDGDNIEHVTVSNNIILQSGDAGIQLDKTTDSTGLYLNCTIEGNIINNTGSRAAANSFGGVVVQAGADHYDVYWKNLSIVGNVIRTVGNVNSRGIGVLTKGIGLVVNDNTIEDIVGLRGIIIGNTKFPVKDFTCVGNRIDFSAGASGGGGISVYGAERGTISGNQVKGHKTGSTFGIRLRADNDTSSDSQSISNKGVCKSVVVEGNQIYNVVDAIIESNNGADPDYNLFTGNINTTCTNAITKVGANSVIVSGANLTAP